MTDDFDHKYKIARKNVKKKKGFYYHLASFIMTGLFFAIINFTDDPTDIWFPIPLAAWSIGLGMHYVSVFGFPGKEKILSRDWEDQQIEKELRQLGAIEDEPLNLNRDKVMKMPRENREWKDDDLV